LPENKIDYSLGANDRKVFLFGVKDDKKALNVLASCLELKGHGVKSHNVIICEDWFGGSLTENTKARLMRNTYKQYMDFSHFEEKSMEELSRLLVA
jgi:hypothetical protein